MGRQHQGFNLLSVFNTKWLKVHKSSPIFLNTHELASCSDEDNGTVDTRGNVINLLLRASAVSHLRLCEHNNHVIDDFM